MEDKYITGHDPYEPLIPLVSGEQVFQENRLVYADSKIAWYYRNGLGWVRFFGYGFHWKDVNRHPLIFSERCGKRFRFQIANWSFRFLNKDSN